MAGTPFFSLFLLTIFLIMICHLTFKNLMGENVFRHNIKLGGLLKENYNNINTAKSELLDYLKVQLKDVEKNVFNRVKASNYYSKHHDSDLHHEETDLSKYFYIDKSIPDTRDLLNKVQCTRLAKDGKCKMIEKPKYDHLTGEPIYYDIASDNSPILKPDHWYYKNERPMNGGKVEGVTAFDEQQNNVSMYPSSHPAHPKLANHQTSYPYTKVSGAF
jgi:hypothetical protein